MVARGARGVAAKIEPDAGGVRLTQRARRIFTSSALRE